MSTRSETRAHHAMAAAGGFFGVYALLTRGGTFGSSETSNLIYLVVSGLDGTWGSVLVRLGGTACYIAGIVFAVLFRRSGNMARLRWGAMGIDLAACLLLARIPAETDPILALYPMPRRCSGWPTPRRRDSTAPPSFPPTISASLPRGSRSTSVPGSRSSFES